MFSWCMRMTADKREYQENIYLLLHENVRCGYSLEDALFAAMRWFSKWCIGAIFFQDQIALEGKRLQRFKKSSDGQRE